MSIFNIALVVIFFIIITCSIVYGFFGSLVYTAFAVFLLHIVWDETRKDK